MKQKYNNHVYEIYLGYTDDSERHQWQYRIESKSFYGYYWLYSEEWFETQAEATFAAIGHIQLLEQNIDYSHYRANLDAKSKQGTSL